MKDNKKPKLIRPFEEIEPQIWGKDFKQQRTLWHIITPETVGSKHFWFGIFVIQKGVSAPTHSHDYDELYLLLEGEVIIEIEKEKFRMKQYDVMYFPAGTKHQTRNFSYKDAILAWIYAPLPDKVVEF